MLDKDLAELYGVETKALTRAVRRNQDRFPPDFMFRLGTEEFASLRSQSGTSSDTAGHGGRRYAPYVFTEQGVAMLSSVLHSKQAVVVNIEIMRAFVEIRRTTASYEALERRLTELEDASAGKFGKFEEQLTALFRALKELAAPPPPKPKHPIGFSPPRSEKEPS